jgi:hypothetical protein
VRLLAIDEPHAVDFNMPKPHISIARLMKWVLVVALAIVAWRFDAASWASIIFLVTCGVLALSIVGGVCLRGVERGWWIWFGVVGWGYMALAFGRGDPGPEGTLLPMSHWIKRAMSATIYQDGWRITEFGEDGDPYFQIGHCLCAMLGATIAATLGRAAWGGSNSSSALREIDMTPEHTRGVEKRVFRLASAVSTVLVLLFSAAAISTGSHGWSDAVFLLVSTALAITAAVAGIVRGRIQARFLGAAVYGWGYLLLAAYAVAYPQIRGDAEPPRLFTTEFLDQARRRDPLFRRIFAPPSDRHPDNDPVLSALEQPFLLRAVRTQDVDDLVKALRRTTLSPEMTRGIPFWVESTGLSEREKTMTPTIIYDVAPGSVPIRTALTLMLEQQDWRYVVKGGLVEISWKRDPIAISMYDDPMQRVMHCVIAFLAAGVGSVTSHALVRFRD